MQSVALQGQTFVVLCLGGLLVGFLFDLYTAFRTVFRLQRGLLTNIGDLVYWLIVTVVVYVLLFITNGGEVRLYMFVGVVLGIWIYEKLLRTGFSTLLRTGIYRIRKLLGVLGRFVGIGMPQALLMGFFVFGGHCKNQSPMSKIRYRKKMPYKKKEK
jgi:spore cortex biosynthesis protein YabQ